MPELPEVETVRLALCKLVMGCSVQSYRLYRKDYLLCGHEYIQKVKGGLIETIDRKGKYLSIHLSNHYVFLHHLGMSGRLLLQPNKTAVDQHTHIQIVLDHGSQAIYQRDARRFGCAAILRLDEMPRFQRWADLGYDPFEITVKQFCTLTAKRNRPLKSFLLDQHFIAGLGNIYVDEALFRARISPLRPACELSEKEVSLLIRAIRRVLNESIKAGGSSTSDFQKLDGTLGDFQRYHRVYRREGKKCKKCGKKIERILLLGRSTHFCPSCQK